LRVTATPRSPAAAISTATRNTAERKGAAFPPVDDGGAGVGVRDAAVGSFFV
jgi:hypothetical protein